MGIMEKQTSLLSIWLLSGLFPLAIGKEEDRFECNSVSESQSNTVKTPLSAINVSCVRFYRLLQDPLSPSSPAHPRPKIMSMGWDD